MRFRALGVIAAFATLAALSPGVARADGGRPLSTALRGVNEIPGPGDADGVGTATLKLNPGHGTVCFKIHVSAISLPATAAHIHQGAAGVAGPILVTLGTPDAAGNSQGCVSAARSIVLAMMKHPSAYYVNVHTVDFPGGALRGQLGKGGEAGTSGGALAITLKGANEVPGPGDPDGTGSASITVVSDQNEVCFTIHVSGIVLPATGAHIHQGVAGVAGPIVVSLAPPDASGVSSGCVLGLAHDLVTAILANPGNYYVNVHTTDYPNGALRGQLSGNGHACGNDHEGDDDDDLRVGGRSGRDDGCGGDQGGDDD
jgi:hypothetical protein